MQAARGGTGAGDCRRRGFWDARLSCAQGSTTSRAGGQAGSSSPIAEHRRASVRDSAGDPKLTAFGKGLLEDVAAKLSQLSANHDVEVVPARTLKIRKWRRWPTRKRSLA